MAEFARTSTTAAVNDYDDEGQAALHVAADKGLTEAISILTGDLEVCVFLLIGEQCAAQQ